MPRTKRLPYVERILGQLDFNGREVTHAETLPRKGKRARRAVQETEPPRYTEIHRRDEMCDHCVDAQHRAGLINAPIPRRNPAHWMRESWGEPPLFLCRNHAQAKRTVDGQSLLPEKR